MHVSPLLALPAPPQPTRVPAPRALDRVSRLRLPLLLACAACALACRASSRAPPTDAELLAREATRVRPPAFTRGDTRSFLALGLAADFEADVATTLGDSDPVEVELDFDPKYGLRAGQEFYLVDGLALRFGVDYRRFEPENPRNSAGDLSSFFVFDEVEYLEFSIGLRWMPECLACGPRRRLRPFLDLKGAYVRGLEAGTEVRFQSEFLEDQEFEFDGNGYRNVGAGLGLAYVLSQRAAAYLGWTYEWPLGETSDDVVLTPVPSLPDFEVPFSLAIEAEGWILVGGVTYGL